MKPRILVAIPLCDHEAITTQVWYRRTTHYLVKACLESFARNVRTPVTVCVLTDRCSDSFVRMAQHVLKRFKPITVDNSELAFGLAETDLSDKIKHIANQFLKTIQLSEGHEFLHFCEQDYLFSPNAYDHALAALDEIPSVNVLSLFDHPDRHRPDRESELGRERLFNTSLSTWKSASSINGNWIWRAPFARQKAAWVEATLKDGGLDYRISNTLYQQGELLLCPVRSLIQHYRLDGSNASPTFGFSPRLAATRPIGRAIARWRRVSARLADAGASS